MGNDGNISYAQEKDVDPRDMSKVFMLSGISRPASDLPRLKRMLENSNLVVTARHGGKLVGIARCVTDFSYCCYLSDLAVDSNYQGCGIGKRLVDKVRELAGEECTLVLVAAPNAAAYYPKIGFEEIPSAWKIQRSR